ncbi:MAG: BamA/TamA family outer membrane protein [Hydrotalea flava]|nr:BamA/TamA family outer membrane protein [Hydrotalea flava]NIM38461.1 BamA/TamA family outer membrane protein [Hydrotalea flava]NIN03631.1 BamA/TamA family outer membrane protein [Hydrotalea flava]NIN15318.1 BamA/TamA family outer membrane protein [Hydrotalea flava]NIO94387.1 BamA/TamA family outer membrane protein [Hydrotalea flava]
MVLNIWTKNDKYNIVSDNRFIDYPSSIYGLGGRTDPNKGHTIDFVGLKLHESILRSVGKNIYAGVGYYYDQFWNIKAINLGTRRINTIITKELGYDEIASGPVLKFLYDNRENQINPTQGLYANFVLRNSFTFLDGDQNFKSVLIDVRKYLPFPHKYSKNTLALWSYNWLTLSGTPPYLLLPSTGWDDQYNTGRGYIQGRFRGRNMVYLEGEYRYRISRNGLIGGVVFANVENFSGDLSQQYNTLLPGYGLGIRVKLNKHSGTNLCVDYGFGKNGSGGFYVNIGEVF